MFLSKAEVEVMTPPPNAHLISISDGPGDQARIDHRRWHSVSYHYFLDAGYTEELIEACGPDFDTTFRSYLRPLAAEKLRDRIDWAAQRAKLIVVNCYAGRSRSAAVARYIHEAYGFALEQEPAEANLTVYRLLMQDPDLLAAYEAATASHTLPSFGGAWGWLKGLVPIPGGNSGGS
jgi:hypothetical protein